MRRMGKHKRHGRCKERIVSALAACLLLFSPILCCSGCDASGEEELYLLGLSQANLTDSWQTALRDSVLLNCEEHEALKCISADAGNSVEKQRLDLENMVKQQVDVIVLSPCQESDLSETLLAVKEAGIPVIIIGDTPEQADLYAVRIYVDYYQMGYLAGECAAQLLNGQGVVLEVQGELSSDKTVGYKEGFLAAIEKYPNVIKEYVVAGYWTTEKAEEALRQSEILSQTPQVDLIFAHSAEMARGSITAAREQGLNPLTIGIGTLAGEETYADTMKHWGLAAVIASETGGAEAVECAMGLIRRESVPKGIELAPAVILEEHYES